MTETVLILGARGRFGLAAARAFADAGWRVLAHMRPGGTVPPEARDDARIQWLQADVHDASALLRAAGTGVNVVVHALNPPYTNKDWQAQVLPMTDASLSLCKTLNATLMVPGNIYNFGTGMPEVLHEDTPQAARTVKGQIRIAMEEHICRSQVRSIVIRAGDFFGSGKGTWFDQAIVKNIAKGEFTYPGAMETRTAWAYLPDLAKTFVSAAQHRARLSGFEVLHFAGHTVTARQWLDVLTPLAQARGWVQPGCKLRYKRLPWTILQLGGLFIPAWASLAEMRYLWQKPHQLDNTKLKNLLGTEPHTPLEFAAARTLRDLGLLSGPQTGETFEQALR